jgi:Tfp pilus assembly protein PilN
VSTLTTAKPKAKNHDTGPARLPQVNLLPQSVFDSRKLKAARRAAGFTVIVALVLGVLGYGGALWIRLSASSDLAAAQQVAASLDDQEAQYAEVPAVRKESARVVTARSDATSTEILWQNVFSAFQVTLPAGTTIQTLSAMMNDPNASVTETVPLTSTTVASIQFTARSQTVPDVAAWMDALGEVDGFVDVWISDANLAEDPENAGSTYYEVQGVIGLTDEVLAHRFDTEEN